MAEELISSYIDRTAIKADTDFFLANLKAVLDAYSNLSGTKVNLSFSDGIKATSNSLNQLNENLKQTSATSQQATQALSTQGKTIKDLSGNYQDLVKQSVQNEIATKALREQRQLLNKDFKDGKITQEQYAAGLEDVKAGELELKVSNEQLSRAMKNLEKDSQAAEGSLDKLRAILNISLQAYDALSAEDKNSDIGKGLIQNIQSLTKEISEQEQATGRFQRNVGNYTGALQPLEKELQRVREELQKTKTAQENLIQTGPPSSNQSRNTSTGTRGPQPGDVQAVANYNSQLQQTSASVAELEKQEQLLNNIVATQQRGFSSATAEIRSLERALFTMQEQGLATTEAFKDIQEKLAEAKREMREFKETQKLLSAEIPGIAAMSLAIKGISGAYAVGAGAAAIFADGNEKVEKELNKLVAIMTALQGLQEVHELLEKKNTIAKIAGAVATNIANTAQKLWTATMLSSTAATIAFRTALIAVTGGLILLLPLAISAFSAMAEASEDARRSQELLNEVNKKAIEGYAEETVQIDLAVKKLQDENLSRADKTKLIDDLQHKYPEYLGNIKNEGELTEDLSKAIKDKLIPALELEAKAKAAQQLATEKYKKILELQNNAIDEGSSGLSLINQSLGNIFHSSSLIATGYIQALKNTDDEVAKLQKDIDGLFKISIDASDAINKLGGGEPTGIKTTIINITKEIEARSKLIELIKQQQIELTKPASDNSENPEVFRLRALEKAYELEKQIIANRLNTTLQLNSIELEKIKHDLNERLTTEKHTAQEIADIKAQAATDERALEFQRQTAIKTANREILDSEIAYNLARGKAHEQVLEQEKQDNDQFYKDQADQHKREEDRQNKAFATRKAYVEEGRDLLIKSLEDEKNAKLAAAKGDEERQKIEQEYNNKRKKIEVDANLVIAESALELAQIKLKAAETLGDKDQIAELSAKIAELKKQIAELKGLSINIDTKDSDEKLNQLKNKISEVMSAMDSGFNAIGSLIDNNINVQKNAIQKQLADIDTRTQKEVDAVNTSLDTEQNKANKIAIINANAAAKKEALETKERQLDIQKARFDKAKNIADAIGKTAIAVLEGLLKGGPPLAAVYAAIGAVEIAAATTAPIPQYKTGTTNHPGGLMWAGDGGKSELVIGPDGNVFTTPSVATLYDMPRGTMVLPDANQAIEQSFNMMYKPIASTNQQSTIELQLKTLSKKLDAVVGAINSKPSTKVVNTWSGVEASYENVSRQWEYINRNTQS